MSKRPEHASGQGFALLLTLLLLAVIAVTMADLGRRSARAALAAHHVEHQLQQRWAVQSTETVLLPQAETLLTNNVGHHEHYDFGPEGLSVAVIRIELMLSGRNFELRFADEQAKLNANTLLARRGVSATAHSLQQLLASTSSDTLLQLKPFGEAEHQVHDVAYAWMPFNTFDQLLVQADPGQLRNFGNPVSRPGITDLITLWGDGRIHWRRTSREVFEHALDPELGPGQIHRLIAWRDEDPAISLEDALGRLDLRTQTLERVQRRLTEKSHCHSLWITEHGPQRRWHHLAVLRQQDGESAQIVHRQRW